MSNDLKNIPVAQIELPWAMLRPVRQDTLEYMELVDSIRDRGLLNSLLVRPSPSTEGKFQIIDGSWRFFAVKDLDFEDIPCIIKYNVSDEDVLALQIAANAVSYETKPIEFAEQMQHMLRLRDDVGVPMTLSELAQYVGKSASWVSRRLKLLDLCDVAKKAFRSGEISMGHAIVLTRVRNSRHQARFLHIAKTLRVRDFELEVGRWIALKRHEKMGERREEREQDLKPRLHSMDALLMELDTLNNISQVIVKKNLTTPLQGAKAMLEWVLNVDEESRERAVREVRHQLTQEDRIEILGRQRYEELKSLRIEREKRSKVKRVSFSKLEELKDE